MSNAVHVEGTVAFSNLTKTDVYEGKDTGFYNVTVTLDPKNASVLEDMGVKLKDYEGTPQRKFKTKYKVGVIDADGADISGQEIPFGSKVRVLFTSGAKDPQYGAPTYLAKVRVLEMADNAPDDF